ncbi:MAG: lipase family protein [Ottowia sp.]|uniref:alpha/beta hydrolase family protein n=1 Tax=Ottowia sp. TaxID=1898956 RepID=UPI0039E533CB
MPALPRLATLALALALAACGGSDDAPPEPTDPLTQPAGTLLSGAFVNTVPAADVAAALDDPDSKVHLGVTPRYAVASYRLTYATTDKAGQPVVASGLVSVPVKAAGARSPVLSYQHATTFHDDQAPSNQVEAVEPPLVLASVGYIVVSPDYVGFGASNALEHPYLTAAPTAAAVVDLLAAAQRWRAQQGVADNGQLFLAGYSEGGYATMAAHRAIHQAGGALAAQLQAAVPGAGPYDVQATLDTQVARIRALSPALAALFDPDRLSRASESVRNEVRRLLLRQMVPDDADVRYQTLFLDRYIADDRAGLAAEHDVHAGWAPAAPVYLFHGRGDLTVPYAASVSALNALRAAGARDVSLTDCTTPDFGHLDCVPEYFRFALERMGRLANDL